METSSAAFRNVIARIERERDVPAKSESFERVRQVLSAYVEASGGRLPENGRGVILVAGTNGKGTVAKTLETVFTGLGSKVGLFTSPHMMSTTERIRSLGRDLSEEEFVEAFRLVEPFADRFGLSHFEILTLMMVEVFFRGRVRPRVERAIIEVGVGGRLDPTRLVPHEISVITTLGLDHQEILGRTLVEIAKEKFGIVDPGNLVVHAPFPVHEEPAILGAQERVQATAPSRWLKSEPFPFYVMNDDGGDPSWILQTPWGEARLGLLGRRAAENSSIALTVLNECGVSMESALRLLPDVQWPCRMEKFLFHGKRVYLSGDHNAQGVESLCEILGHFKYRELRFVIGIGKNKSPEQMLRTFRSFPTSRLMLTLTPFRATDPARVLAVLREREAFEADPVVAFERVLAEAAPEDLIVVSGSLYLAGFIRSLILRGEASVRN